MTSTNYGHGTGNQNVGNYIRNNNDDNDSAAVTKKNLSRSPSKRNNEKSNSHQPNDNVSQNPQHLQQQQQQQQQLEQNQLPFARNTPTRSKSSTVGSPPGRTKSNPGLSPGKSNHQSSSDKFPNNSFHRRGSDDSIGSNDPPSLNCRNNRKSRSPARPGGGRGGVSRMNSRGPGGISSAKGDLSASPGAVGGRRGNLDRSKSTSSATSPKNGLGGVSPLNRFNNQNHGSTNNNDFLSGPEHSGRGGGASRNGSFRRGAPARSKSTSAAFLSGSNTSSNESMDPNAFHGHQFVSPKKQQHQQSREDESFELYTVTGIGNTAQERQVIRWSAEALLSKRMIFLNAFPVLMPSDTTENRTDLDPSLFTEDHSATPYITRTWSPHEKCLWTDQENRIAIIEQEITKYLDYKPLQVNDDTRWKPKVIQKELQSEEVVPDEAANVIDNDAANQILKQSILAILNKLSWTNLDKLTVQFLKVISETTAAAVNANQNSDSQIYMVMSLVVEKAMYEPHFAELYANLTVKLTSVHKTFKRCVLLICQDQFEETGRNEKVDCDESAPVTTAGTSSSSNPVKTNDGVTNETAKARNKKASIGLMKYIGELYKLSLIKYVIMISCLNRLLQFDDEEKLECFSKLMATIGERLHQEVKNQEILDEIWDPVYSMASLKRTKGTVHGQKDKSQSAENTQINGPVAPSVRIKFMLQGLIELKENNWVQVRHEQEKAKTIEQIHKDVAAEEEIKQQQWCTSPPSRSRSSQSHNQSGKIGNRGMVKRSLSSDECYVNQSSPSRQLRAPAKNSVSAFPAPTTLPSNDAANALVADNPSERADTKVQRGSIRRAKSDNVRRMHNMQQHQSNQLPQNSFETSNYSSVNTSHESSDSSVGGSSSGRKRLSRNNSRKARGWTSEDTNTREPTTQLENGRGDHGGGTRRSGAPSAPVRKLSHDNLSMAFGLSSTDDASPKPSRISRVRSSPPLLIDPITRPRLLSPSECAEKCKSLYKEYFLSYELHDTILSIHELVGTITTDGYHERCVAVIEAGILMVMEMKETDVQNFLVITSECLNHTNTISNRCILDRAALVRSLKEPLELLRDIEIDAPMAATFLATIIANWLDNKFIFSLEFLLYATPDSFRSDGRPAEFTVEIIKKMKTRMKTENPSTVQSFETQSEDMLLTDEELSTIEKLLTPNERNGYTSAKEFTMAMMKKFKG